MALEKLSVAIEREYEAPYPKPETALRHFQALYHCEKRGEGRGTWYVDRSRPLTRATGHAIADDILRRVMNGG